MKLFDPYAQVVGFVFCRIRPVSVRIRCIIPIAILTKAINTLTICHHTNNHTPVISSNYTATGRISSCWVGTPMGTGLLDAELVLVAGVGGIGVVSHSHWLDGCLMKITNYDEHFSCLLRKYSLNTFFTLILMLVTQKICTFYFSQSQLT